MEPKRRRLHPFQGLDIRASVAGELVELEQYYPREDDVVTLILPLAYIDLVCDLLQDAKYEIETALETQVDTRGVELATLK